MRPRILSEIYLWHRDIQILAPNSDLMATTNKTTSAADVAMSDHVDSGNSGAVALLILLRACIGGRRSRAGDLSVREGSIQADFEHFEVNALTDFVGNTPFGALLLAVQRSGSTG